MKRFKSKSRRRSLRRALRFVNQNGQLLFLTVIMLCGTVLGCCLFFSLSPDRYQLLDSLFLAAQSPSSFAEGCTAVVSSAFSVLILLIVLFLLGLTAYGCPLILLIPLFFGLWIGVSECYAYATSSFLPMLLTTLLPVCITAVAVLIATMQSLHMSCLFSRQLLPNYAHCGSLWHDFKLYLLRFMLCMLIAVVAAVIRLLCRMYIVF